MNRRSLTRDEGGSVTTDWLVILATVAAFGALLGTMLRNEIADGLTTAPAAQPDEAGAAGAKTGRE